MTTLDAALPLDEPYAAPRVEQDLDLHVAGPPQVLLDEQIAISEICKRYTAGRLEGRREVRRSIDPGHPDPTATRGRFEEHRVPDLGRDGPGLLDRFERSVHALGDGHSEASHRLSRGNLVARQRHRVGRRTDENQASSEQRLANVGFSDRNP